MLVGTKLDLVQSGKQKREVGFSEALNFAAMRNLAAVVETSAKSRLCAQATTGAFSVLACGGFDSQAHMFLLSDSDDYVHQLSKMRSTVVSKIPSSVERDSVWSSGARRSQPVSER